MRMEFRQQSLYTFSGESSKWYRFTTPGDGSLGTMIRLDPAGGVRTEAVVTGVSGVVNASSVNLGGENLELGTTGDKGIIEFDLSAYLSDLDDPNILKRVTLRLGAVSGADVDLPDGVSNIVTVGNSLFFTVQSEDDSSYSLWKSDGSAFGTTEIADLAGTPYDTGLGLFVENGRVFLVQELSNGRFALDVLNSNKTALQTVGTDMETSPNAVVADSGNIYFVTDGVLSHATGVGTATAVANTSAVTNAVRAGTLFYAVGRENVWSLSAGVATEVNRSASFNDATAVDVSGGYVFITAPDEGLSLVWSAEIATGGNAAVLERSDNGTTGGALLNIDEIVTVSGVTYATGNASSGGLKLWILDPANNSFKLAPDSLENPSQLTVMPSNELAVVYGTNSSGIAIFDPSSPTSAPTTIGSSNGLSGTTAISDLTVLNSLFGSSGDGFIFSATTAAGAEPWKLTMMAQRGRLP